ncbi:tRNA lysidine(34) synthetase TilS [Sphingobacterium sp.]|uniref:tRNA lysidine(34) synthetase TilS n=1 Tax=Sphingobacterium sp. TaxID=341027 RepID=UPI0028A6AC0D|nr:tRNA lysidine(34) synthetase TilS [Sphingobacterium sp.]
MSVSERLKQFIIEKELLDRNDKILLAVSGGKDSMLMARLFHDLKMNCIIAHCNFQLRGEESDKDEALVLDYAKELGYPLFVRKFETDDYATQHKVSIQMAARELRYQWFEELRAEQNCQKIAIAQHANDHLETMLFNLTRSTGIQGLLGIQAKRGPIIRPLLFLSASEVAAEVQNLQVPYRDDQSNFSTKYARNKIRLEIIPKFKEIQPDFEAILEQDIKHFEESQRFIQNQVDAIRKLMFQNEGSQIKIQIGALQGHANDPFLIFELFKPYNFQRNVTNDLIKVLDKRMGQIFESPSHELLLDRDMLILREKVIDSLVAIAIEDLNAKVNYNQRHFYIVESLGMEIERDENQVQVDADLIKFPLVLRPWQIGDTFKPLGMEGSKKLSDYFIQKKLNRFQKEDVPILVNADGQLIWIVGMRLDNRFKVTENTKKVLTLVYK